MSRESVDLLIIGAGPAGLSAATLADALGLSVLLLDEQNEPGGQIYRAIESVDPKLADLLGADYRRGAALVEGFRRSGAQYRDGAAVWRVDVDGSVAYSRAGEARIVVGRRVLLATGAQERPTPIPGWTLPGVMSAGGAQVLLKSSGIIPAGPVVVAGNGPLALLITGQLIAAGATVAALLETTETNDYIAALPHLPRALRAAGALRKGMGMRRAIKRAGVPILSGVANLAAQGDDHVTHIAFDHSGQRNTIPLDTLLLHAGVVPNIQITRLLDCAHEWVAVQRYWRPVLDRWGATDCDKFAVAGDGGGIIGAEAAAIAGQLAALDAAHRLGVLDMAARDARAAPLRHAMARHLAIRPLLDTLFRPDPGICVPRDDATLVCRCEEVTAGDIRVAVDEGAMGPNQIKAFLRCGMGPCQGRMCGLPVAEIIAAERRATMTATGAFRVRPPIKPLRLSELAALDDDAFD
jgi:NADPH-dependent 2,4-dienoyl-CoA reductase/sulfur reductase-like enzyme